MRKSIILIIALGICGLLVGEAWALRIQLGHHSANDIRRTCGAVGGDFFTFPGGTYGCSNICAGGTASCVVSCTSNGNCVGDCPPAAGINPSSADRMKLRAS
jgi:hypothetical protein